MTEQEQSLVFATLHHRMYTKRKADNEMHFISFLKANIHYFRLMKKLSPQMFELSLQTLKDV